MKYDKNNANENNADENNAEGYILLIPFITVLHSNQ